MVQSVETLNTLLLAGGRGGGKSVLLVWLVAEADRLELVSELALTTAPMATGMATGQ